MITLSSSNKRLVFLLAIFAFIQFCAYTIDFDATASDTERLKTILGDRFDLSINCLK